MPPGLSQTRLCGIYGGQSGIWTSFCLKYLGFPLSVLFDQCSIIIHSFIHSFLYHRCYTECNRKNGPNFGRVFLMLNYTEKTQNTYVQSLTVWEIMAIENYGLPLGPRSIAISWFSYLLVCLLSCAIVTSPLNIRVCKAGVLRHHSTFQCHV